jgi:hypothetical protein
MVFEKNGYTLYSREQPMRGRRSQTVYFFSKRKPVIGTPIDVPDGYIVSVERRSGVPYLNKQ